MFDFLLTPEQKKLQEEAARFVREKVPKQLILDMDAEKVVYPKDYLRDLGQARLLGMRFAPEYGGRGLSWVDEVAVLEEIGVLGTSLACLYSLPSIVGEAISHFGSQDLKQRYLKPTLEGRLCTAEALTEPRGGSDFFGTTTTAKREGIITSSTVKSVLSSGPKARITLWFTPKPISKGIPTRASAPLSWSAARE